VLCPAHADKRVIITIIQGKTMATSIQGTNGKFDVTTNGNQITIKYTGDPNKITCKKIVFIQMVTVKIDGTVVKPMSKLTNLNGKHLDDDQLDGGGVIDHVFCEKDPYYNGDDKPQDGGTQGNTDTGTPSEMTDAPYIADSDLPNAGSVATVSFETCAYCVDNNTFLDCITWTYTRTKGDSGKGTVTVGTTCAGPSQNMKDAKTKFDTNHTKDGKPICPEEAVAVPVDKTKPGGTKTIVVEGGTEIRTWDLGVYPDAILQSTAQLDTSRAALSSELLAIERGVAQLSQTTDSDQAQPIVNDIMNHISVARGAAATIDTASRLIRTDGIQQWGVTPEGGDGAAGFGDTMVVDPRALSATQVKLTYLNGQFKPIPTLIFNAYTQPLDMSLFEPFKRPGIDYGNDDINRLTLTVQAADVQGFASDILANPALSNTEFVPSEPYLSVTIVGADGTGFESLIDEANYQTVLDLVLANIDHANVFAYQMATKWTRIARP
jgi:hypothetical protein